MFNPTKNNPTKHLPLNYNLDLLWTNDKILLLKLDSQLGVQWQKQLSDGVHKFETQSNIREYAGEIYYSGSYRPDPSVLLNNPVVFAKLNPDGDAGVGCGFLDDTTSTAQSVTLATPLPTTTEVDQTVYDTNSITVSVSDMTNVVEDSSCEETYPTLAINLDHNQGRVEGTIYGGTELIIDCGDGQTDCSEIVESLSTLQLTAYPKAGYAFSHWEYEGAQTTSNPVFVVVSGDTTWAAVFRKLEFKLPLPANYNWLLTVECGGDYLYGLPNSYHQGSGYFSLDFVDDIEDQDGDPVQYVGDVPILAAEKGVVIESGGNETTSYGYTVVIDHDYPFDGTGFATRYAHLKNGSSYAVDDSIERGQELGVMGSSGSTTTAIHLHLQFYYDGISMDSTPELEVVKMEGLLLEDYQVGTANPWEPEFYPSTNE